MFEMLEDKQVDGVLSSFIGNNLQNKKFLYSEPFYRYGAVAIIKKEHSFDALKNRKDKRVAVKRGSPILFHIMNFNIDPKQQ